MYHYIRMTNLGYGIGSIIVPWVVKAFLMETLPTNSPSVNETLMSNATRWTNITQTGTEISIPYGIIGGWYAIVALAFFIFFIASV